ncbi:MAG: type I-U CRISPR-associated protein Cas5/Cas6 [Rubrivivax sp.]|nr:type I-U CRISPR-associated protein Cas5/Cas6 [Rubrivivax sp.]
MPALLLRFPGRRYHATPWGHHVNEGLIEWPPSPWRLLRALLATGYAKRHWPADGPPPAARRLVDKLAAVAPQYRLPRAVGTHSRHYMPLARFKNGREETTLVFDTWAQVDDGEIAVHWDVTLDAQEHAELEQLASGLDYVGRSESWVEAKLVPPDAAGPFDVRPGELADCPGPGWEQVALLAPVTPDQYTAWRARAVAAAAAAVPTLDTKGKPIAAATRRKALDAIEQAHPRDALACLQVETAWLQRLGWNQPPGTQKLLYWRRADSLATLPPKPQRSVPRAEPVTCMLLALASASGRTNTLPRVDRSLAQGELLHRALVDNACRLGGHSVALSGCDEHHRPLTLPHQHAHLLHLDLDADGHLDHILIWAPMGLDANAQAAVRATRRTYAKGASEPLRLALAGSGDLCDLELASTMWRALHRATAASRAWVSATAFVPPRHLKESGVHTLEGQVRAELLARGLPGPASVGVLDPRIDKTARRLRHHVRTRRSGPRPAIDIGFALRLEFDAPVAGPICLGYASHFGLGRFEHADGAAALGPRPSSDWVAEGSVPATT